MRTPNIMQRSRARVALGLLTRAERIRCPPASGCTTGHPCPKYVKNSSLLLIRLKCYLYPFSPRHLPDDFAPTEFKPFSLNCTPGRGDCQGFLALSAARIGHHRPFRQANEAGTSAQEPGYLELFRSNSRETGFCRPYNCIFADTRTTPSEESRSRPSSWRDSAEAR